MRRSLFSPLWYRVAGTRPRLHVDVHVEYQRYRDQTWYLLLDAAGARSFRLNPQAYALIGRLDGERSVEEVWDILLEEAGDDAPTQDEVLRLLTELTERGLLDNGDAQAPAAAPAKRNPLAALNPLAFRVPLGDPWPLIVRLDFLRALMFFPGAAWVWLGAVAAAAAAAALNWGDLAASAAGTRWMWLAWLVFPPLKAAHELAHALAVRQFGGEVHKAGISVFLLTPAPYVDASDAAGLRSRGQRALVGAAGVMAELAIAALAMAVWVNAQPGFARDLAFATLFTASVSTFLFNGNPLLRFDAYYVLSDLLDVPNLAARSAAWWGGVARRVLGAPAAASLDAARGETKWLVVYGPASLACRVLLGLGIVLWLGGYSLAAGAFAACVVGAGLLRPLLAGARALWRESGATRSRARVHGALGAALAGVAALVFALPLPMTTAATGVVWLPESARLRPEVAGFISRLRVPGGSPVAAGDTLVDLADPVLEATRERLLARLSEQDAERNAAMLAEKRERGGEVEQEILRTEAELRHVEQRLAGLAVKSGVAGTLVLPHESDLPGSFVERGATLGYVLDREQIVVRAAIAQEDAALVRERTQRVRVRLAEAPGVDLEAVPVRDAPATSLELPSAALGEAGGGSFPTDPEDKKGVRLAQPVVLIDLKLPAQNLERVGSRAYVRFEHGAEPLAAQAWRYGRALFLARFNPAQ